MSPWCLYPTELDKHALPWHFGPLQSCERFIGSDELLFPRVCLISQRVLYFTRKLPPPVTVSVSVQRGMWICSREANPEEQAIYLPPYFCLVDSVLWEVKGCENDEAEPCIRNPADPTRHHNAQANNCNYIHCRRDSSLMISSLPVRAHLCYDCGIVCLCKC